MGGIQDPGVLRQEEGAFSLSQFNQQPQMLCSGS